MARISPEQRRQELVRAALAVIVERGVGELRTRDVAARVGITHASLHYHFPSKKDLIRAVLGHVIGEQLAAPARARGGTAAEQVRALFSHTPPNLVALKELHQYADRDPEVYALLEPWFRGWRRFLVDLLVRGKDAGEFRGDLDPDTAASVIMLLVLGSRLGGRLAPAVDEAVMTQLEHLLGST